MVYARGVSQARRLGHAVSDQPPQPLTPEQWLKLFEAQVHAQALAAIFAVFPETVLISTSRA
jgi:hypothetical protein